MSGQISDDSDRNNNTFWGKHFRLVQINSLYKGVIRNREGHAFRETLFKSTLNTTIGDLDFVNKYSKMESS